LPLSEPPFNRICAQGFSFIDFRLFSPEGHAGAEASGNQALVMVSHIAFHQTKVSPGIDYLSLGPEPALPHRAEEIDL
jgi:hypothetical protein